MNSIVNAALTRRIPDLSFRSFSPPHAASLARLLAGGTVTKLCFFVVHRGGALLDTNGALLVGEALRANTTLTALELVVCAAEPLLGALVSHSSLRSLTLACDNGGSPEARGALLAALVAANAPALQSLSICCAKQRCDCKLGDAGLGPLVDALPHNHHLRQLNVSGNGMSEDFARSRLLPAVRSNTDQWLTRDVGKDWGFGCERS
jgi:hypothetical protein